MKISQLHMSQIDARSRQTLELCGEVIERTWAPRDLLTFPGSKRLRSDAERLFELVSNLHEGDDAYYTQIEPGKKLERDFVELLVRHAFIEKNCPLIEVPFDLDRQHVRLATDRFLDLVDAVLERGEGARIFLCWNHVEEYYHNDSVQIEATVDASANTIEVAVLEFHKYRHFREPHILEIRKSLAHICSTERIAYDLHQTGFREIRDLVGTFDRTALGPVVLSIMEGIAASPRIEMNL